MFNDSRFVILDTAFLHTLSPEEIRSGYAEMLKHGLISDVSMWAALLNFPLAKAMGHDADALSNCDRWWETPWR